MFTVGTAVQPYRDPWLLPLSDRLRMLAAGQQRVAYYYEEPNNSTFRYRAYNMAQALNAEPARGISASWFHRCDHGAWESIVELADVLVICRSGYEHRLAQLIARARSRGVRVLFDVDDLVFDTAYTHLVIDTLGLDKENSRVWDDWFGMMARMGHTLRCCDGAIATNAFLAERIRAFCGRPVAVVPNFMNREQLEVSDAIYAEKRANGFAGDGRLTLGYFSGSPSHRHDFALIEPALERLMDSVPDLRVMTVGYIEPGPGLARFGGRLVHEPFHDFVNLQRLLSTAEINLMPLQANVFTDCKSELKYFEAAAVGTLSVASPSVNYVRAIDHGRTGYLARAHQWEVVLKQALASMADYPSMAAAAREDAVSRFGGQHQRGAILRALGLAEAPLVNTSAGASADSQPVQKPHKRFP